jgi:hypothetical protein
VIKSLVPICFLLGLGVAHAQDSRPASPEPGRYAQVRDLLGDATWAEACRSRYAPALRQLLRDEEGGRLRAGVVAVRLYDRFAARDLDGMELVFAPEVVDTGGREIVSREELLDEARLTLESDPGVLDELLLTDARVHTLEEARELRHFTMQHPLLDDGVLVVRVEFTIPSQDEPEIKWLAVKETAEGWRVIST